MSLHGADLFPNLIVLTPPQEYSANHIPRIFEVTMQATKPRIFVDGKDYL